MTAGASTVEAHPNINVELEERLTLGQVLELSVETLGRVVVQRTLSAYVRS